MGRLSCTGCPKYVKCRALCPAKHREVSRALGHSTNALGPGGEILTGIPTWMLERGTPLCARVSRASASLLTAGLDALPPDAITQVQRATAEAVWACGEHPTEVAKAQGITLRQVLYRLKAVRKKLFAYSRFAKTVIDSRVMS